MLNFASKQTPAAQSYPHPGTSQILFFFFRFFYTKKAKTISDFGPLPVTCY